MHFKIENAPPTSSLEEEGSTFRAQLRAKEEEVDALQGGLLGARQDYQVLSLLLRSREIWFDNLK